MKKEFQIYENEDRQTAAQIGNVMDGKFSADEASEFMPYLINNIFSQEVIQGVRDTYATEMLEKIRS